MISSLKKLFSFAINTLSNKLFFILYTLFLCLILSTANAQLKRYPLQKQGSSAQPKTSARIQSIPTLPFWDDFSFHSKDANGFPTANTDLWEKSESVWINNGMGINQPTVYVATLDGLNANNVPYNAIQVLENGSSDTLRSKAIDLSAIPTDNLDSVYLSFYYQWKGNGEPPDDTDYLAVDFKDKDNKWVPIDKLMPGETPDPTQFLFYIKKVEAKFFYNNFQFLIRRYGRASGPFDTWNIDYVYLNINRHANDNSFPDRAAASALSPLFGRYRSMPLPHFLESKLLDSVAFDVKNLKNQLFTSTNYSATAKFTKSYTEPPSSSTTNVTLVTSDPINSTGGFIDPFGRVQVKLGKYPDPENTTQFDPAATSIDVHLKMQVISDDQSDLSRLKFSLPPSHTNAIDLRVNDSISTTFSLDDYYAYDDGIAEYSVGLTNPGNMAAVQFDLLTEKYCILEGFDIYFPDFALSNNVTMDFKVYSAIDGTNESQIASISANITRKGLNSFTNIRFNPGILVKDKVYIGWIQPAGSTPKLGLDLSNDVVDKIFVKTSGTWTQNTSVHGAIMIRPVFTPGEVVIAGIPKENDPFILYPNPNEGTFFIKGKYDHLQIINVTGQSIKFSEEAIDDKKRITLHGASGLYLLHLRNGTTTLVRKVIVR